MEEHIKNFLSPDTQKLYIINQHNKFDAKKKEDMSKSFFLGISSKISKLQHTYALQSFDEFETFKGMALLTIQLLIKIILDFIFGKNCFIF